MTSKSQGFVDIELDGKLYKLQYPYSAIDQIEAKYEMVAGQALAKIDDGINDMVFFLFVGLQTHHPEITEKKINLISPPIFDVKDKVGQALALAYAGPIQKEEKPQKQKAKPPEKKPSTKRREKK